MWGLCLRSSNAAMVGRKAGVVLGELFLAFGVLLRESSWSGICGADGSRYRDDPVVLIVLVLLGCGVGSHGNVGDRGFLRDLAKRGTGGMAGVKKAL